MKNPNCPKCGVEIESVCEIKSPFKIDINEELTTIKLLHCGVCVISVWSDRVQIGNHQREFEVCVMDKVAYRWKTIVRNKDLGVALNEAERLFRLESFQ